MALDFGFNLSDLTGQNAGAQTYKLGLEDAQAQRQALAYNALSNIYGPQVGNLNLLQVQQGQNQAAQAFANTQRGLTEQAQLPYAAQDIQSQIGLRNAQGGYYGAEATTKNLTNAALQDYQNINGQLGATALIGSRLSVDPKTGQFTSDPSQVFGNLPPAVLQTMGWTPQQAQQFGAALKANPALWPQFQQQLQERSRLARQNLLGGMGGSAYGAWLRYNSVQQGKFAYGPNGEPGFDVLLKSGGMGFVPLAQAAQYGLPTTPQPPGAIIQPSQGGVLMAPGASAAGTGGMPAYTPLQYAKNVPTVAANIAGAKAGAEKVGAARGAQQAQYIAPGPEEIAQARIQFGASALPLQTMQRNIGIAQQYVDKGAGLNSIVDIPGFPARTLKATLVSLANDQLNSYLGLAKLSTAKGQSLVGGRTMASEVKGWQNFITSIEAAQSPTQLRANLNYLEQERQKIAGLYSDYYASNYGLHMGADGSIARAVPTPADIAYLKANHGSRASFAAHFGRGSATPYIGLPQ